MEFTFCIVALPMLYFMYTKYTSTITMLLIPLFRKLKLKSIYYTIVKKKINFYTLQFTIED